MKNVAALMMFLSLCAWADDSGNPQERYDAIPGESMILERSTEGGVLVGVNLEQKQDEEGFCRRSTPVVPDAESSYACFWREAEGPDAEELYLSSSAEEIHVAFQDQEGHVMLGSSWTERAADDHGLPVLCVKTAAVVPDPVPEYRCYTTLPPVGGGISGGN